MKGKEELDGKTYSKGENTTNKNRKGIRIDILCRLKLIGTNT